MWSRIACSSNNANIYRLLQHQSTNEALLPCIFDHTRPTCNDACSTVNSFHLSSMIRRQKHSQTQIKRLFKEHPARLRVEKRIWNIDRTQPRVLLPDITASQTTIVPTASTDITSEHQIPEEITATSLIDSPSTEPVAAPLLYPPIYTIPTILPNGWFPPMDPKLRPEYPFSIRRTKNKPKDAVGFLPIYTKYRKDGTKVVTRIKNISGDIDIFVRELRIVLSVPQPANQLQSYDAIRLRAGNMVEIQGHRAAEIRRWLGQLGF